MRGRSTPSSPIRKLVPYADGARARGIQVFHLNIGQPDIETPEVMRHALRDYGQEVIAYGPSAGDAPFRAFLTEYYADLGVELFMTKGPAHGEVSPTLSEELDCIAAVYEDLAEHGDRLGVTVTYHPHEKHFVDSTDEWRRFMPRLNKCRMCLDVMHAVLWEYDPCQAARDFADHIAYVHLHGRSGETPSDLDDGPLCDYAQFLSTVEKVGFSGWVVVLPGGRRPAEESMRRSREYLRGLGY